MVKITKPDAVPAPLRLHFLATVLCNLDILLLTGLFAWTFARVPVWLWFPVLYVGDVIQFIAMQWSVDWLHGDPLTKPDSMLFTNCLQYHLTAGPPVPILYFYVLGCDGSAFDALTWTNLVQATLSGALFYNFVSLILKTFVAEMSLDFVFYWQHRMWHSHPWLYKIGHKQHHAWPRPGARKLVTWDTYNMDLLELVVIVLTAYPGMALGLKAFFDVNGVEFAFIFATIKFWEDFAHSDYKYQCPWLATRILGKLFGFEFEVSDHSIHHDVVKINYGKRFKLWDLICGTYHRKAKTTTQTTAPARGSAVGVALALH